MKHLVAAGFISALLIGALPTSAQPPGNAERASRYYRQGWESFHREDWANAVKAFQQAIDVDPKFALAYYSLGRAHMASRNFVKAIAAYTACRDLYLALGGERFTNQLDADRRLADRILEYQTALSQATQSSTAKSGTQSQNLMARELQNSIARLEQARDRNINVTIDVRVPYFVPLALGAAYFRSSQFADAEREDKAAIEANPACGEAFNNLGVLYMTIGRLDDAAKQIKLAEDAGYKVNPQLKRDLDDRRKGK